MDGDPIIEVRSGGGLRIEVVLRSRLEVGRDCTGLIVDDALLSRRHLALAVAGGTVTVWDLGSRNGTTVDGVPVAGPTPLRPGQVLLAGSTEVRVSRRVAVTPPPMPGTDDPGRGAGRDPLRETVARVPPSPPVAPADQGPVVRSSTIRAIAEEVTSDPGTAASVNDTVPPGSTMTFLFSDIEGSTEQTAALGDDAWVRLLTAHNRVVEEAIGRRGGVVVKSVGDGYMATFASARAAVRCATSIQRELERDPIGPGTRPVRVRIGLHTGEAIAVGGDLFGYHVNLAARVAEVAEGGQILVSALTRAVVEVAGEVDLGPPREVTLKGLGGTHAVSEVIWRDDLHPTAPGGPGATPRR